MPAHFRAMTAALSSIRASSSATLLTCLRRSSVSAASGPVYLRDLATVSDGPADVSSFVRFGQGPAWGATHAEGMDMAAGTPITHVEGVQKSSLPSVTIAVAKKKGTNAVWVARDVLSKVEDLSEVGRAH